ncbi:hypothetical protein [Flavobacterium sp.]|jgi:hypothetical protein|uniref:hypothetical protein n=1 Tax=Flavobacterium sp. TaxID=239 RepID=UPI0037C05465
MKKAFLFIVFLFAAANSFAQSTVYVQGYTRSNGTYVQGHYRTAPDATITNNWSTVGNVNPYTGKPGTVSYSSSTSSYSTYSSPSYSTYSSPSYSTSTYSSPSYSTPVYTGSRGGTYYVNSNGNKTYIK